MSVVSRFSKNGVKVTAEIYDPNGSINRITGERKVGLFMAETVARYMNQYIPKYKGPLSQSYTPEPFKLTYFQPYAHYQYNGVNFNFNKEHHPLATHHWDEAVQRTHKNQIAKEVTAFIRRQG